MIIISPESQVDVALLRRLLAEEGIDAEILIEPPVDRPTTRVDTSWMDRARALGMEV
jgi:hypothetical protein